MAVHKVPQDVEAEDKFLGPLSFKQFLFGGGTVISGYMIFLGLSKNIWPLSVVFFFPFLAFAMLTFPWSKEQPTELWLAARIRFFIKPRRRIWDQTGLKDLVNVTAPIHQTHALTDGLSATDVQGRLSALATMVDSRGWAVKNHMGSSAVLEELDVSDRLVDAPVIRNKAVQLEEETLPDVLDDHSGTIARQFETMIDKSETKHKSETMRLLEEARGHAASAQTQVTEDQVEASPPQPQVDNSNKSETLRLVEEARRKPAEAISPVKPATKEKHDKSKSQDFWFKQDQQAPSAPTLATFQQSAIVTPGAQSTSPQSPPPAGGPIPQSSSALSDDDLLQKVHEKQRKDALQIHGSHIKTLQPLGQTTNPSLNPTVTTPVNPDILALANSNDLNVETLARQAGKNDDELTDEVVVPLR